jgi:hypothetical protein
MLWITISHPLLVVTPNWCKDKCITKTLWNWKHKLQLVNWYNTYPTTMEWTSHECLVVAKKGVAPRTWTIRHGMWPCATWKKSWNNYGKPQVRNLLIENSPEGVQKPSKKDHLQINVTCIGMSIWKNQTKIR